MEVILGRKGVIKGRTILIAQVGLVGITKIIFIRKYVVARITSDHLQVHHFSLLVCLFMRWLCI
jgi:hypothetical protein